MNTSELTAAFFQNPIRNHSSLPLLVYPLVLLLLLVLKRRNCGGKMMMIHTFPRMIVRCRFGPVQASGSPSGYTAGKIRRYLILENVTIRRANFKGRVDKKRELSDNNQDLTLPEIEEMMRLRKEKPKRTWTTEEQQLIPLVVSCYSEGESIRPLAKRMGLSFNKARNMLLENGIEIRKGGGVPGVKKPIPEKQLLMIPKLVKEYKTHTLSELMKKHHLSSTRIRILLRMGGVTKFKTGPKKGKKSVLTEAEFNLIPLLIEEYKSVGIRELHRLHPQLSEVKIRRLLLLGRATIRVSGDNSRKIALSILE